MVSLTSYPDFPALKLRNDSGLTVYGWADITLPVASLVQVHGWAFESKGGSIRSRQTGNSGGTPEPRHRWPAAQSRSRGLKEVVPGSASAHQETDIAAPGPSKAWGGVLMSV